LAKGVSDQRATGRLFAACGTPPSFAYDQAEACCFVAIGSLDDPGAAPIERTGADPANQELLARLQSRQR
jgi:hypothetical protein